MDHLSERFAGRVALVSGASSGMGRATSARLLAEGAQVVLADVDADVGVRLAEKHGANASYFELDVTDFDQWNRAVSHAVERFGGLDVLVNCAGILRRASIEESTLAQWRETLAVNLDGTCFGCMASLDLLRQGRGGAIVNLASMSAVVGDPDLPAYVASKGAVEMLTREIAVQCARSGYNVRCNAVLPGTIDTPMVSTYFEDPRNGPVRSEWFDRIPLGRVGTPQEAAALITFLVSDEASFLTGGSYRVDGGMTA